MHYFFYQPPDAEGHVWVFSTAGEAVEQHHALPVAGLQLEHIRGYAPMTPLSFWCGVWPFPMRHTPCVSPMPLHIPRGTAFRPTATGGAHPAARNLGNCCGTGDIVPFWTCGSLVAQWTYAFGAHLGLSQASRGLPSYFLHPKLRGIDAVLITPQPIPLPLRRMRGAVI